jgi:hypothetical protein
VTQDPQRRAALLGVKLGALVRDAAGEAPVVFGSFGGGAALVRDGAAWVLADEQPVRALGATLAWARQHGADAANVITDDLGAAGVLARRATYFARRPGVWHADGRALVPAEPVPRVEPPAVDERLLPLAALIEAAGAVPTVEHGVLVGEVAGLEVCRAAIDGDTGAPRLEVGVGAHDREAFQIVHGNIPPAEALAAVVTGVAAHRRPGAEPHPLNRLAAERLLRHRLVTDPSLIGAVALEPVAPPVRRDNLKDPVPCVAAGVGLDGEPLVVVCSVGVDLDLVPFAADARAATGPPDAALLLAMPERDALPVTRALADALEAPATVVPVPPR